MFRVMFTCRGKKRQGVSTAEGSEQVQRLTTTMWGAPVRRTGAPNPAGSDLGLGIILLLLIRCRINEKNLKLFVYLFETERDIIEDPFRMTDSLTD